MLKKPKGRNLSRLNEKSRFIEVLCEKWKSRILWIIKCDLRMVKSREVAKSQGRILCTPLKRTTSFRTENREICHTCNFPMGNSLWATIHGQLSMGKCLLANIYGQISMG